MPSRSQKPAAALVLVCGEDNFSVSQAARAQFTEWCSPPDIEQEIIDAAANNTDEALRALAKLREALATLPFFGGAKVIWFKGCNFLGEERTASSLDVVKALSELADSLKTFQWQGVQLLISAGKVDKRRTFYKTLDKVGRVEVKSGWSVNDRDWEMQAQGTARQALQERGKGIAPDALRELILRAGGSPQELVAEIEKLALYTGDRPQIVLVDVETTCIQGKHAQAFALGEALGERNLPLLLRRLDEELWAVKLDPRKSEIGLLYGIISKVRSMLLLKEMLREKWIRPTRDFAGLKSQLERLPEDQLPEDRRYSPLGVNPYVLFKALPQVAHFSSEELVRAMDLLLQCNRRLVGSGLNPALVIQQTLTQIVGVKGIRPEGAT
jgi:DNA polymerase-3 subunit delta